MGKEEADKLGKGSFAFAFYMDRQKEERERGVTISCTTKEFFTESYHYTVIDAPGHRDFIKNMITGASQADVALLMVPSDGNFTTSIAKGNAKAGEVQGQTRQHSVLINLLGVKQLLVGVNKMDCDVAKYGNDRYTEIKDEMMHMLKKVGWKKGFVDTQLPVLPISGWMGDNLIKQSTNMDWWKGMDIVPLSGDEKIIHVNTLLDCLEKLVQPPKRTDEGAMRVPLSGVLNIKGLPKDNMPRVGDIMVTADDATCARTATFTAQIQVLNHPGELKPGYTPIAFVRTGRSAVKMTEINWKVGKSTGGQKVEGAVFIKAGEMGLITFEPAQPFVVESFKKCEGLGRLAIMEGNSVVMLGKCTKTTDYVEK